MTSVFLDTDVVLDFYIERQPHHDVALRLFTRLKQTKTKCYTSAVVIANAYYILSKLESREYAVDRIRKLRKLVDVAPLDASIIDAAITSPYKDFEDSVQFHCAIQNKVETFITRNVRHYPKERLRVADPSQFLSATKLEKLG
jgi:predicted nucleic acid-binding protein